MKNAPSSQRLARRPRGSWPQERIMCLRYLTRAVVGAATQEIALEDVMRRPTALSRRLTRLRWIALGGCLTISVKIYFSGFKVLQGQSDR
jgi:hypothetical protein